MEGLQKGQRDVQCQHHRCIDFNTPQSNFFQLECINVIYAMQFDAVYFYTYIKHAEYDKFMVPPVATANPMNKDTVIVPPKKQKPKLGGWILDDDN